MSMPKFEIVIIVLLQEMAMMLFYKVCHLLSFPLQHYTDLRVQCTEIQKITIDQFRSVLPGSVHFRHRIHAQA